MTDSTFTYDYELGTIRNVVFHIGARHDPSTNHVESFAVVLYFRLADGRAVEVAKIDDTPHGEFEVHLDRYYREIGAREKSGPRRRRLLGSGIVSPGALATVRETISRESRKTVPSGRIMDRL